MDNEYEKIVERLKVEFIDGAKDRLDEIDSAIDTIYRGEGDRGELFVDLQRQVHSLKGSAGSYGLGFASIVAHRLEDYLESSKRLEDDQWLDVQKFVDQIRGVIESGEDPESEEQDRVLSTLPRSANASSQTPSSGEKTALIIMPPGVQRKAVSGRLSDHGIGVSFSDDPLNSIGITVSLKPDVILSNQEFSVINGTELANMLAAVAITRKIPFGLMTSHDAPSEASDEIGIIKKDNAFLDNVSAYLTKVGLVSAD